MNQTIPPPTTLLGGIARLAFFNRTGFAAIGNTSQAFLASLSPLIGFTLVLSGRELATIGWRAGMGDLLQTLCILLGQPVASNFIARLWHKEAGWLRYAAAMNWCQLAIPVVGLGFVVVAMLLGPAGPSPRAVAYGALSAVFVYAVVLNWFLAWRGLDLSAWRAALFVVLVTGCLGLVVALPAAARLAMHGLAGGPGVAT